jgi:hypothetical protein
MADSYGWVAVVGPAVAALVLAVATSIELLGQTRGEPFPRRLLSAARLAGGAGLRLLRLPRLAATVLGGLAFLVVAIVSYGIVWGVASLVAATAPAHKEAYEIPEAVMYAMQIALLGVPVSICLGVVGGLVVGHRVAARLQVRGPASLTN